ncbi:hypothetical protein EDB84DRAFT_1485466 [Lactarius hengduanensis]|nr:hypothetical protein EDB84DRAFT_1485466 [Lactarius hengduanensis]
MRLRVSSMGQYLSPYSRALCQSRCCTFLSEPNLISHSHPPSGHINKARTRVENGQYCISLQSSQKSFRTKRILAKAACQNRLSLQFRLQTDTKIQVHNYYDESTADIF